MAQDVFLPVAEGLHAWSPPEQRPRAPEQRLWGSRVALVGSRAEPAGCGTVHELQNDACGLQNSECKIQNGSVGFLNQCFWIQERRFLGFETVHMGFGIALVEFKQRCAVDQFAKLLGQLAFLFSAHLVM